LSPYSPDFLPIKNLWSKVKNILRSIKTTNYQELGKAIEFAFNEVTERKYLELAQVTAVIVPHLSEKGYSALPSLL
jgi:transposase